MITLNKLTQEQARALHNRLVARYNDRHVMTDREIGRLAILCNRAFYRIESLRKWTVETARARVGGTFGT